MPPRQPQPTEFARLCREYSDDPGMQAFVLEWETLGISGCEALGDHLLSTGVDLAFTYSEVRRGDANDPRFRPWQLSNKVIEALATLPNVFSLRLEGQPLVTDLSPFGKHHGLHIVRLAGSGVHDLSFVTDLRLFMLQISDETVDSLLPLRGKNELYMLTLSNTGTADLTPLSKLTRLFRLEVERNGVVDAAPFAHLTGLGTLSLADNAITDLTPVLGLTQLSDLSVRNNQVRSVAPLVDMISLTGLDLSNNQIVDLTPLAGLERLSSLAIDQNAVTDLDPLATLARLTTFTAAGNAIDGAHCPVAPTAKSTALSVFCSTR